jgi:hypothetical protein
MKEEFEKWAGDLAECENQDWWFERLGLWVMAWKAGVSAFKAELKNEFSCYESGGTVSVNVVLALIDKVEV